MNMREGKLLNKVSVAFFLVAVVAIVGVFSAEFVENRSRLEQGTHLEKVSNIEERSCIEEGSRPPKSTGSPTRTWQEWQMAAEEISYRTLVHHAEQHKGTLVYYRGRVDHVFEGRREFQLRVDVTSDNKYIFDALVFLRYEAASAHVQVGDIIAFVGRMNGTVSYHCVMGGSIDGTVLDVTALALIIENQR